MTGHTPTWTQEERKQEHSIYAKRDPISTDPTFLSLSMSFPKLHGSMHLLLLDTTTVVLLGVLDGGLVALGLTLGHEATGALKGTGQVTSGGLAEHVDLDQVGLEGALQGNDGLDEEGVGVLHV